MWANNCTQEWKLSQWLGLDDMTCSRECSGLSGRKLKEKSHWWWKALWGSFRKWRWGVSRDIWGWTRQRMKIQFKVDGSSKSLDENARWETSDGSRKLDEDADSRTDGKPESSDEMQLRQMETSLDEDVGMLADTEGVRSCENETQDENSQMTRVEAGERFWVCAESDDREPIGEAVWCQVSMKVPRRCEEEGQNKEKLENGCVERGLLYSRLGVSSLWCLLGRYVPN